MIAYDDQTGTPGQPGPGFTLITPGVSGAEGMSVTMEYLIDPNVAPVDGIMYFDTNYIIPTALAAFRRQ